MIFGRFASFVFLVLFSAPAPVPVPATSTLTISISGSPVSSSAPLQVVASSGTIVSAGQSYRASADTLRLAGSAELTTRDPVFAGTFVAGASGNRLHVDVRVNGDIVASGTGEAIVVIRTPLGAELQAMAASALRP